MPDRGNGGPWEWWAGTVVRGQHVKDFRIKLAKTRPAPCQHMSPLGLSLHPLPSLTQLHSEQNSQSRLFRLKPTRCNNDTFDSCSYNTTNEKALGETQTLLAGCSKAEPKFFSLAADPLPGGTGQPNFNQLEVVTTFTYKPSLVKIDARNFE